MIRADLDPMNRTELHYAAHGNRVDRVAELLAKGDDVNARDKHGFTPLHLAAQEYALEAGVLLLDAGASVDGRNQFGNAPLFVAVFNSNGRGEFIELLLAHGADPDGPNDAGQTPRGLSELIGNSDAAQFFIA